MKKIIYIINARIPTEKAHGYQVSKMCEQFARAGQDVELWMPARYNPIKEDIFSFYGLKKKFRVETISGFDFLRMVGYLGRLSFWLNELFFFFRLLFKKAEKDAIIYSRNPEIIWLFGLKGFKTCYECHIWFGKDKGLNLFFLRKADYVIVTNNFIGKEFLKNGFPAEKILTAPNGIDLEIFDKNFDKKEALQKLNLNRALEEKLSAKKILLYTGTFKVTGFEKGIADILSAVKISDDENILFLAVGGNEKDIGYYQKMAEGLEIQNRIFLMGRVSPEKLALFQKTADILLMPFPKIAHYEFFMTPLKMFEYLAARKPIIASDLPSIREILNDKNCLFCRPGDAADLSAKIKLLLADNFLAGNLSRQAYQDAQKYTWQKRAEKILNFIE